MMLVIRHAMQAAHYRLPAEQHKRVKTRPLILHKERESSSDGYLLQEAPTEKEYCADLEEKDKAHQNSRKNT